MRHQIETVAITPTEFENQVKIWLETAAESTIKFNVTARRKLRGSSGEYEIDAVAEFEIFGGAKIIVLVECKYYTSPVKRDVVMLLNAKIQEIGAHKGIVFATSGFQSGALEYARVDGIATVNVVDGDTLYETKAQGVRRSPPPWLDVPRFAGWFISLTSENLERHQLVTEAHTESLTNWLIE